MRDLINNILVRQEQRICGAYYTGSKQLERGSAEASFIEDGVWYLNRILIQPEEIRGKGIGTALLKKLQNVLKARSDFTCLVVEPGGYNQNVEQQRKFFENNGFTLTNKFSLLEWVPKDKE